MPALGSGQQVSYQYLDYSGEKKSITLPIREVTALTIAQVLLDMTDVENALDAVTLGTRAKNQLSLNTIVSNTRPTDKDAQIETEMLVTYIDDTTEQSYSFRITTADYTAFNYADPPAGDTVIIAGAGASTATTNLVTALEELMRSPSDDSHTITITGMRVVR